MRLAENIRVTEVPAGQAGLFSLGQAGFVFKTPAGRTLAVDPYLSDAAERQFGFKRMIPSVIEPHELKCDLIITTHEHVDHYDPDSVPIFAGCPRTLVAGTGLCQQAWLAQGLPAEKFVLLERGQTRELQGFHFRTTNADHADLSPDCLGLLLEFGTFRVYLTSDTAYRPALIPEVVAAKPEVIIPVINGRFGNLDPVEAAQLTADVGARAAIPSHFGMFVEHGGDPMGFLMACACHAPAVAPYVMAPGEFVLLPTPRRITPVP